MTRFDSIASRLALTVVLAISAATGLNLLFIDTAGFWGLPSLRNTGLLEQGVLLERVISAAPPSLRPRLAASAGNPIYQVRWAASLPMPPRMMHPSNGQRVMQQLLHDPGRNVVMFEASEASVSLRHDPIFGNAAFGMALPLDDGSWLVFGVQQRSWGLHVWHRRALTLGFILFSTAALSLLAARSLAKPIEAFAIAARRFGTDPKAPPMAERGPRELRAAAAAFNAMQTQIGRFVTDRTIMLAAISHDLRTPLTRIRLRGEYIDDADQQARLFRDVAEMQAMIDAALSLFHDAATEEGSTDFDLSELVRDIVDDLADQGRMISFEGIDHVIYHGRPFALKRAIGNIAENACIYGGSATAWLNIGDAGITLSVLDQGPGIAETLQETVFSPFYRAERSRNRQTGGAGLGLTSARTIVRAHGGDITLHNHDGGGLLVLITLKGTPPGRRSRKLTNLPAEA